MATIGISLIAHNEAAQIEQALASASFADQIVVVNCDSTDNTCEVVEKFPDVKLLHRPNNPNLNINKTFGFEQLSTDWIFYLDPDEIIPPSLAKEIREAISSTAHDAFRLPRRNYFFGRWLAHGGQYPDKQLRLFRRGSARFPMQHVHESLAVDGTTGRLTQPFDHHPYPTLKTFIRKMNFYTSFQADYWFKQGFSISGFQCVRYFFFRPLSRFLRRFVLKRGFSDGWQGYIAALGDAFQIAISFGKLLELHRKEDGKS